MSSSSFQKSKTKLIEEHLPYVKRICTGFADSQYELDELVQEVSIQLWKNLDTFQGKSKLTTWIYRVTVNICLYQVSKKKKENLITTSDKYIIENLDNGQLNEREIDLEKILYGAIKELAPIDKAIIMLYLDKKSHIEIADIMGMTTSNVGVRINRSKKKLKNIINDRAGRNLG